MKQNFSYLVAFLLTFLQVQAQAAGVDMAPVATLITDQTPGLTSVGTAMVGLVVLVTIFAIIFSLLRR